ncbi:hypothetical protein Nepgr_018317 [Nepenthes gracilis]|uniref:Uncharacterized protein n=1 Tax=Nepenthes gracilis TaxID=150966 RepID=A0AAD3SUN2_NEPGR|nr:hypothetical protein Nepgr_018317 [Nepenthes gracilis]
MHPVTGKRKKLLKLSGSFLSVIKFISDSAETINMVSKDSRRFLQSDSDEIPNSLRKISKVARSDEFSHSCLGFPRLVKESNEKRSASLLSDDAADLSSSSAPRWIVIWMTVLRI